MPWAGNQEPWRGASISLQQGTLHVLGGNVGRKISRVVLVGHFGTQNYGNDATLASMVGWLTTLAPIQLLAMVHGPAAVGSLMDVPTISLYADREKLAWLPDLVRGAIGKLVDGIRMVWLLHSEDVVVVPGSGVFEETLSGPFWGLGLSLLTVALAARIKGARLAFVGIGAAYQRKALVRWMTRRTLSGVGFLTLRDEQSRDALTRAGVAAGSARVFPDIVMSQQVGPGVVAPQVRVPPLRIGLGVLSYFDREAPEAGAEVARRDELTMAEFAGWLVGEGHEVVLLTGDGGDEAAAWRVRVLAAQFLAPGLAERISFPSPRDFRDVMRQVERLDVVIAARFHNLVFAMLAGRPVISVGYSAKCSSLLSAAGLGAYATRLQSVELNDLKERFGRLAADLPAVAEDVASFRDRAALESERHREELVGFITSSPASDRHHEIPNSGGWVPTSRRTPAPRPRRYIRRDVAA